MSQQLEGGSFQLQKVNSREAGAKIAQCEIEFDTHKPYILREERFMPPRLSWKLSRQNTQVCRSTEKSKGGLLD